MFTYLIEIPNEFLIKEWAKLVPVVGAKQASAAVHAEVVNSSFAALHFAQSRGLVPRN